jgi:hypothetical protein
VTDWTPAELAAITRADSLGLTVGHEPHPEVELGMVLVHGELYVRAYQGPQSRWFQAARESGRGRIRVGAVARDVLLMPAVGPVPAIDAAYQAKYGNSSSALIARPQARAATLRITPA